MPCRARDINHTRVAGQIQNIMPNTDAILHAEAEKEKHTIILYSEGIFYKAYEHSAWLACLTLGQFMTKKKFIKKVGRDVISIGFPKASLGKRIGDRKTVFNESTVIIFLNPNESETIADCDYNKWKDSIDSIADAGQEGCALENELISQIREFPIESKTPIECMIFLSRLKQNLTTK